MNYEVYDLLKAKFPAFEDNLLKRISEIAVLKTFAEGEMLMRTGQYFRSTMLVVDGLIKLYREGEDGGEFFVYFIEPGNACALSMVCASQQRMSEVMAKVVQEAKVVLIPIDEMDKMMLDFKTWYYFVVETYRKRFEELLQVIDAIAFTSMDERLEFYLRKQQEQLGTKLINITHQEIATDIHSSREVISRLLKKMEQRGMVKLHRNQIEILNLNA